MIDDFVCLSLWRKSGELNSAPPPVSLALCSGALRVPKYGSSASRAPPAVGGGPKVRVLAIKLTSRNRNTAALELEREPRVR